MKRLCLRIILTIILIILILGSTSVYAENNIVNNTNTNIQNTNTQETENIEVNGQLVELKEKTKKDLQDYEESYGSKTYGLVAFVLNKVRVYSIPICFIGFAVSAIYQNVIGVHRLDMANRGYTMMISMITLFVIAQLLPLIFAIVMKGWSGQAV